MKKHYDTDEECFKDARKASKVELTAYSKSNDGSKRSNISTIVLREIEEKERDQKQIEITEMKLKREEPHTLVAYWKKAHLDERLGMIAFFFLLIMIGFAASAFPFLQKLLDLIKNLTP